MSRPAARAAVEAVLLGIAQDAGVPQAGCACDNCRRAWQKPRQRHLVACLGLIDHAAGQSWLIDATPDFREQLFRLQQVAPNCRLAGILLTHVHMGHYTGLIQLGPEAMNARRLPLYCTPKVETYLRENRPWRTLLEQEHLAARPLRPDAPLSLSAALRVTPLPVPHRDEFSDTLAFVAAGPQRSLLYCPDIDGWEQWSRPVRQVVAGVDVALLDGSFFDPAELPGRDISQIPTRWCATRWPACAVWGAKCASST
ncbi:MAG: pyrroloquinoline quinone biosynthesis protein PqqB [Anaerolineae bacterium]